MKFEKVKVRKYSHLKKVPLLLHRGVQGILEQYQYYCMFCLVTNIVRSNLKSKNQEVSGFSDQWVLNAIVDFNEI